LGLGVVDFRGKYGFLVDALLIDNAHATIFVHGFIPIVVLALTVHENIRGIIVQFVSIPARSNPRETLRREARYPT
jgi:hypothetical protein